MTDALLAFAGIGGLSGFATLITAIANLRNTSKTAAQFTNNGGSSAKDSWDRIEARLDTLLEKVEANTARIEQTNAAARAEHTRLWHAIRKQRRR